MCKQNPAEPDPYYLPAPDEDGGYPAEPDPYDFPVTPDRRVQISRGEI
jgi:hypothetical protein